MVLDELKILDSISLDFSNNNIKMVNAKQTDTESRYVDVSCTDHGKKVILTPSTSALVVCKKPDGFYVLNRCAISEKGTVLVELTQQMLAVYGKAIAEIILFNGTLDDSSDIAGLLFSDDGEGNVTITGTNDVIQMLYSLGVSVLTTMSFYINILPSVISNSQIESSYEFNALVDGLAKQFAIEQRMETLEDSIKESEEIRVEAENTRINAEESRVEAEQTRQTSENIRIDSENTRIANENIRISNENIRIDNENTRQEAEENRVETFTNNENERAETFQTSINGYTLQVNGVIDNANVKIDEMQGLLDELNGAVSGVIKDNESSDATTYSSQKINETISNFSNPNLLRNAEFKIVIDEQDIVDDSFTLQSDDISYHIYDWGICNLSRSPISVKNYEIVDDIKNVGGLYIQYETETNEEVQIYQYLSSDFLQTYNGKNYVITQCIDGEIIVEKGNITLNGLVKQGEDENTSTKEVCVKINKSCCINYVKLELGTMATSLTPKTFDEESSLYKKIAFKKEVIYPAIHDCYNIYLSIPALHSVSSVYSIYPEIIEDMDGDGISDNIKIDLYYGDTTTTVTSHTFNVYGNQLILDSCVDFSDKEEYYGAIGVRFNCDWYINTSQYQEY